jgi:hypothetical protein
MWKQEYTTNVISSLAQILNIQTNPKKESNAEVRTLKNFIFKKFLHCLGILDLV